MSDNTITKQEFDAMSAPFSKDALEWRAIQITKNKDKGLAYAYITPRAVMDRFDVIFGSGWSFMNMQLDVIDNQRVGILCSLTIKGITRVGIGESAIIRNDNGQITNEPYKSAGSDAIKRAAMAFGVGRYLYSLPSLWLPINNYRKFTVDPYDAVFDIDGNIKVEALQKDSKRKPGRPIGTVAKPPVSAKTIPKPPVVEDIPEFKEVEGEVQSPTPQPTKPATPYKKTDSGDGGPTQGQIDWLAGFGIEPSATKEDTTEDIFAAINNMNETPLTKQQLKVIIDMSDKKGKSLPDNLAELNIKTASPIIGSLLQKG